jgi:hypothetical protein
MRNLPTYDNYVNQLDENLSNWVKVAVNKGKDTAKSIWDGVKLEASETKEVARLLGELIKGEEITDEQKAFIKAQSIDLAKALPLIAIQGIPIPIPITPFLILLSKKIGWEILPNSHTKTNYKFG